MHPFWATPDVVSEVISLLPKADQARIAQVNTPLWEIAISYIWRDVPDIRHIFRLFPSDLWNGPSASPPQLNKELKDSDWTRFLFHSNNTRTTSYTTGDLRKIVPLEIWSHRLFSASFPVLDRLSITVVNSVDEGGIDVVPLLLRPSLHSIEFLTEEPTADSPLISTLQTIAETTTLSLEEMEFHFFWNVGPLIGVIAQAIASQTSLRRLTLNGYSDIALLAGSATDLPLLEELEVQGMFADVPDIDDNDSSFRSLTTFTAVGRPAMIHSLLRAIGSNRLARVALTFSHWRFGEIHPELIVELQRFRPHLVHLQLTVDGRSSWRALQPVLNLAELQAFDLEYPQTNSEVITDDQLQQMIDAWPNLTRLRLQVGAPQITLTSLAYIATHCPNVRKLALNFDARKTWNSLAPQDIEDSAFSKNALELFDVMASTFSEGDEERLADMFRCWWPKARLCQSDGDPRATVHWDIDDAPCWPV